MAVNRPKPRAQPEDKVGLRYHKSLVTVLYYFYISWSVIVLTAARTTDLPYSNGSA